MSVRVAGRVDRLDGVRLLADGDPLRARGSRRAGSRRASGSQRAGRARRSRPAQVAGDVVCVRGRCRARVGVAVRLVGPAHVLGNWPETVTLSLTTVSGAICPEIGAVIVARPVAAAANVVHVELVDVLPGTSTSITTIGTRCRRSLCRPSSARPPALHLRRARRAETSHQHERDPARPSATALTSPSIGTRPSLRRPGKACQPRVRSRRRSRRGGLRGLDAVIRKRHAKVVEA